MNIKEVKERVQRYKELYKGTDGWCDKEDFSDDVVYLLSLIEQAEKSLGLLDKAFKFDYIEDIKVIEQIAKNVNSGTAMSIYMQQAEEMEFRNRARELAIESLKSIQGEG